MTIEDWSKNLLPIDASYETCAVALEVSQRALIDVCASHLGPGLITYPHLFGFAAGRRAVALSTGFRLMVEQTNSVCALPIVRMLLDTCLRLYAGFFVDDHTEFCRNVLSGRQINKMKADDGRIMTDKYLVDRVASRNPWMTEVYELTSGYIHFSGRHMKELFKSDDTADDDRTLRIVIGPSDYDREPRHFVEPMRCAHHLNLILAVALQDWFTRMCSLKAQ